MTRRCRRACSCSTRRWRSSRRRLIAGYRFRLSSVPAGLAQRFLGIQFVTVGTHGAGNLSAGFAYYSQQTHA